MSILIKGMEMPKNCEICPFGHWSNIWQTGACTLIEKKCFADFSLEYRVKRSDNCPLVEIPTPHGRLIDADKLFQMMENTGWYNNADRDEVAEKLLLNAPVVIKAENDIEHSD